MRKTQRERETPFALRYVFLISHLLPFLICPYSATVPDVEHLLQDLTPPQRQAATHVDGPLLIIAGAGSGKTRVITRRVAYLLAQKIAPSSILAITFTN